MTDSMGREAGVQIDAAGNVTYKFDGRLIARGLDIFASTLPAVPPAARTFRWVREADGVVVAADYTFDAVDPFTGEGIITTRHTEVSVSDRPAASNILSVRRSGDFAGIAVSSNDADPSSTRVTASADTPTGPDQEALIIDAVGKSSFLQLAADDDLKANLGSFGLTFPGAPLSDLETINHGLGRTPTAVFCTVAGISASANHICAIGTDTYTNTTFRARARNTTGAAIGPGDLTAFFLAIG